MSQIPREIVAYLTCSICHEIFTDPKDLPCGHTFCRTCLESCTETLHDDYFPCPLCRNTVNIQEQSIDGCTQNFLLRQMAGKIKNGDWIPTGTDMQLPYLPGHRWRQLFNTTNQSFSNLLDTLRRKLWPLISLPGVRYTQYTCFIFIMLFLFFTYFSAYLVMSLVYAIVSVIYYFISIIVYKIFRNVMQIIIQDIGTGVFTIIFGMFHGISMVISDIVCMIKIGRAHV